MKAGTGAFISFLKMAGCLFLFYIHNLLVISFVRHRYLHFSFFLPKLLTLLLFDEFERSDSTVDLVHETLCFGLYAVVFDSNASFEGLDMFHYVIYIFQTTS